MISTYSVPRVEYVETDYYIVLPALEQNYRGAFAVRSVRFTSTSLNL